MIALPPDHHRVNWEGTCPWGASPLNFAVRFWPPMLDVAVFLQDAFLLPSKIDPSSHPIRATTFCNAPCGGAGN